MRKIKIKSKFDSDADVVLFKGDCLELVRQIPDGFCKLVVTSPPYNVGKLYEKRLKIDKYLKQQQEIIKECVRILDDCGSICWQVGNYIRNGQIIPLDIALYPIFADFGLKLRNRIIWTFGHGLHASKRFSGRYETILWFTKSDKYTFNLDPIRIPQKYPQKKYFRGPKKGQYSGNPLGKNPGDFWDIPNVEANHVEKTIHPCQFPVELIERLVLALTDKGDWIFDPFLGVGTTAISGLMHGRKILGSEVVEDYVKIAKNRIRSAEQGNLRIRPRQREIFNPNGKNHYIPPLYIDFFSEADRLNLGIGKKRKKKAGL